MTGKAVRIRAGGSHVMDRLPNIDEWPTPNSEVAMIAALAVGVLYCFLGYRTLKFLIGLTGFVLAGAVGAALGSYFGSGSGIITAGAALLGGIAGAFALLFLYRAGVFLIGLIGAAIVAQAVLGHQTQTWVPLAIIGAGIVGGVVALVLERPIMILATSAIGAWIAVCAGAFLVVGPSAIERLDRPGQFAGGWVMVACWAGVALTGAALQFATYRRKQPAPQPAK